MNIGKTETMILTHTVEDYPESIMSLNNKELQNSVFFKYLGSHVKHDNQGQGNSKSPSELIVDSKNSLK